MKLSILICHLEDRIEQLQRLRNILTPQLSTDVEIIVEGDRAILPTGTKRNMLLDRALGDYICFIDDDDTVPDYYVQEILKAIVPDKDGYQPDVVGIQGHYFHAGNPPEVFIHSTRYDHWYSEGGVHCRPPNHLNPVKRAMAIKAKFPDEKIGEDHEYSNRLVGLLRDDPEFPGREVFIEPIMYNYYSR